jgi:HAD superfamily hydrolase (TIGR01509 family)
MDGRARVPSLALTLPGAPQLGGFAALVLDLDGLLVDTEPLWLRAKEAVFRDHGARFGRDDQVAILGADDLATAAYFARRLGLGDDAVESVRAEYLDHAAGLFRQGVKVRPGALDLVAWARERAPVGLASNTRRSLVDLTLERAGLEGCFDAIATGDEADPKPAPGVYALACERLGVAPAVALAIEDTPAGVRAAKAAGMTCVAVPSHAGVAFPGADLVVDSLHHLLDGR